MRYIGVKEAATKWNISERSVRNYCTNGRIPGAVLDGKTWDIPEDAVKPQRKKRTEKIETSHTVHRERVGKDIESSGWILQTSLRPPILKTGLSTHPKCPTLHKRPGRYPP